MSPVFSRFTAIAAGFVLLSLTLDTAVADDSLRLKRDLRACIDKSIAAANSLDAGDVGAVLSACNDELQAFMASITDSTRIEAVRFAISGYVQANLEPTQVAEDSSG